MVSRREFLGRASCCALAALTAARPRPARAAADVQRPNIVWIYSDDHAQNAVSAYGSRLASAAPTPNIDRIAREGVIFRNSFVTNSLCGPCRAVVLTGKHSHINGFCTNSDEFDGSQQTFPRLLQNAGYQTALFGKWHLVSEPTGFDAWEVLPGQGVYYNPDFITAQGRHRRDGYVTDIITDLALDWLQNERNAEKPFMLMIQNKAPHREWEPAPEHLTTYDDVTIPEPDNLFDDYSGRGTAAREQDMTIAETMRLGPDLKVWETVPDDDRDKQRTFGRMAGEQRERWQAAYGPKNKAFLEANLQGDDLVRWKYQRYMKDYLRCIASIDDNVGRVLDYLEASGLDKNTVVFYASDQSFYLGEHGWFDKRFIYEESLRTPFVARWPGVTPPGSEVEHMVQNLDCAQTFLDIAGVPIPGDMQGRSLRPFLLGQPPQDWRTSIYYHYYEGEGKVHNVYKHYGVRTARYKLVHFYTLGEWEFYDLENDPHEMRSEYANPDYAPQIAELKAELARLRELYRVPEEPAAQT
ncbi:MAG TPA: sulfatase [Candidatus Hydrogenedentes bacterium]|nr:sulfatase [Candidatus Hydrogenedentota bacterium]